MQYVRRVLQENFSSQVELANHLGIERSHLGKLINGKHTPTNKTIKFLAQGLSRVDGQDWKEHANNIKNEVEGLPSELKIIGE
jgi:transcriptional regulator with XRE-family HTH domain